MVTILIGNLEEYNSYYRNNIVNKYSTPLILNRNNLKNFRKFTAGLSRPIVGDRILIEVSEDTVSRRDFDIYLQVIESYVEHSFIDILWNIKKTKGNFHDIFSSATIVHLYKTRKSDLINHALLTIHIKSTVVYFLNKIAYNWNLYNDYIEQLRDTFGDISNLTETNIDAVVIRKKLPPLNDVLLGVLALDKSSIRAYYQYCERYTTTWVKDFFTDSLDNVIKLKIRIYKDRTMKLTDVISNTETSKYYKLLKSVNISSAYILLTLMRTNEYPIETYITIQDRRELLHYLTST